MLSRKLVFCLKYFTYMHQKNERNYADFEMLNDFLLNQYITLYKRTKIY